MCSLKGGYGLFPKCVNLNAQKQWTGLAQGKDQPLIKEVICQKKKKCYKPGCDYPP